MNALRKKALISAVVTILGGWGQAGHALDPRIDPSRPSTQQPTLPEPRPADSVDTLKLPGRPKGLTEPEPAQGETIVLQRVRFEGNSVVPTEELEAVAKPYLGRGLNGADLEQLRYNLTLLYVNKGYLSSGAVVPGQNIKDGVLRIQIVEGRLTRIRVTDITDQTSTYRLWPLRDSYIQNRLMGDPDQPLKSQELQENYLKLLNDRMIERLNGSLLPGSRLGEAVLDLKVTRARPYGGYVGVDNFSPPQIGQYTGRVGFWVDNLATLGERIDFNMSPTGGAFSWNTGADIPLTASGTRFAFRYTNAETSLIEAPYDVLNILNNIVSYDGQLSHPVLWDLGQKLTLGLNFAVRQNRETLDGVPLNQPGSDNGQTQATVVRTWQDYLYQANQFESAFRSTFSWGVDALGATVTDNNQVGNGLFFAWLGQAVGRYRFLDSGAYVSLSGAVQLTNDRLLSLEKIATGGFSTVRGYRQNYLVRDQGFYASLEVGYPLYGGEPGSKYGLFFVPFTDYGGGGNQQESWDYLQSIGVGLEGHTKLSDSTLTAGFYWAGRLVNHYRGNAGSFPQGAPYTAVDNGINFQVNWQSF